MALTFLELGPHLFSLHETGPSTVDEELAASIELTLRLNEGWKCVECRHLGRGKERFRARRALGKHRELRDPVTMGFPILNGDYKGMGNPRAGIVVRGYADRETLEWSVRRWKAINYQGRWINAPLAADDEVPETMNSDLIRARMGWSQSYLEKMTVQFPELTKNGGDFGAVEVRTLPFLALINDAKFPFLRDHRAITVILSLWNVAGAPSFPRRT
jgi:hypothetical protein